MNLWRISNHDDLTGLGGERSSGRWHTAARGKRIVYMSEHPALALIEALANLKGNPQLFPATFQLMKLEIGTAPKPGILTEDHLPENWRQDLASTQAKGDEWLAKSSSALLAVPSAPAPESRNYLLNPLHPDARYVFKIWCRRIDFDRRLFHTPALR